MKSALKPSIVNLFGHFEKDASSMMIEENIHTDEDPVHKLGRTRNISQIIKAYRQQPLLLKCSKGNSVQDQDNKVISWLQNNDVGENGQEKVKNHRKVQIALGHLL